MKWLHKLLKGMSLTAALFVFQACYGTPAGYPDAWEETAGTVAEAPVSDGQDLVSDTPDSELPADEDPDVVDNNVMD